MYDGVRVRKVTHLTDEVGDELIIEAEKIYHDVMWPDEPKAITDSNTWITLENS